MSEISRGCVALCVFLILGNKGPLFPREAAGRNLALWLALVPLLCAAFSCTSWYHPSQQWLMRQDTRQQPHKAKPPRPASTLLLLDTQICSKIPINTRNRGPNEGFPASDVGYFPKSFVFKKPSLRKKVYMCVFVCKWTCVLVFVWNKRGYDVTRTAPSDVWQSMSSFWRFFFWPN